MYVNFREERRVWKVVKCTQNRHFVEFFRQKMTKKNEKMKNGQNVTQNGAKCMYFYVQNESRLIFIRKKSMRQFAGL